MNARSPLAPRPRRRMAATPQGSFALRLESLEERWLPSQSAAYGQLPLAFEPNLGQAPSQANFLAHGSGYGLLLSHGNALLNLSRGQPAGQAPSSAAATSDTVSLSLIGGNPAAQAQGRQQLPGVSNYLIGNDPSQWHTNIPTYAQVAYHDLYPGVDLVYYGNQGQLEYDFILQPGAEPGSIRVAVRGAQSLSLDGQGDLVVHTAGGDLVEKAPVAYQEVGGVRQQVAARFVLQDQASVGIAVGAYDARLPLVLDPVLLYSTYLGGFFGDAAYGIAVDSAGSAYVTGETIATDFPTVNPLQRTKGDQQAAFVAKLNPQGTALVYSTYLGGTDAYAPTTGNAIAVDSSGDAYVAGDTQSTDFPTVHPVEPAYQGNGDAFVAELDTAGNGLIYSTYLGGSQSDGANGIAVDGAGNTYIAGGTTSSDFPTTVGAFQTSIGTAFVTKIKPSGAGFAYSTYVGTGASAASAIAVDATGSACIAGGTSSVNFPTANAAQPTYGGDGQDGFVTKLSPSGGGLVFSTYLGGSSLDECSGIAVDPSGNVYVTGDTQSSDFPVVNALQRKLGASVAPFVAKYTSDGSRVYASYLSGTTTTYSGDQGMAIAADTAGDAYVTGFADTTNFPTANAPQPTNHGFEDAFVAKLNPSGSALIYSTYLGGSDNDRALAIAVDSADNAYVAGKTSSSDFPTVNPVQAQQGSAFIAKIANHVWQGQDVAVGSDDRARLLWESANNSASVWAVNNSLTPAPGPVYGAFSGWTDVAEASGSDGLTRLLWTNANGAIALWLVNGSGGVQSTAVFGPIAGWTARDVGVDSSNNARILWTNASGAAVVWSVASNFSVSSSPVFGPYAGWNAVKVDAGADGLVRLLWDNFNGTAALWLLNANGTFHSAGTFGPIAGWTATDVAVGSDGGTRLLWDTIGGSAAIWDVSSTFSVSSASVYGPFRGWMAEALGAGSDGILRLLWDNLDGTAALWLLGNNGSFENAATFGPF